MIDSLSPHQKSAYDSLSLGPVWVSREQPPSERVPLALCLVFKGFAGEHSNSESALLNQLLGAIKLDFVQAVSISDDSLQSYSQYETLIGFDLNNEIDSLINKGTIQVGSKVALPSLAALLAEGKSKAFAWKALKAFARSKR
jgi:hypothetical protein